MNTIEAWGTLLLWAVAVGPLLWGTWYALRNLRRRPTLDGNGGWAPVSILKPLKGADDGLEANLTTFFTLDYPSYELLISVAEASDPACLVVRRLMTRYPRVPSKLIIGDVPLGPNPKVNNLACSYREARNDLLLISDSNVRVEPDYLKRLVAELRPGVGMVTQVVAGTEARGWGGWLESAYLNSFYARWMHFADCVNKSFVVGKAMLFHRSTLDRVGGINNLAGYIAEDYMAGQAIQRLGLRVALAREPVRQHIGSYAVSSFWSRHLRWGRIRKAQAPFAFWIEPLHFPIVSGALGAWGFHAVLGVSAPFVFAIHLLSWATLDAWLIWRMEGKLNLRTLAGWLTRECLAFPLWLHMASGSAIRWRGTRLKILPGGLVQEATPRRIILSRVLRAPGLVASLWEKRGVPAARSAIR